MGERSVVGSDHGGRRRLDEGRRQELPRLLVVWHGDQGVWRLLVRDQEEGGGQGDRGRLQLVQLLARHARELRPGQVGRGLFRERAAQAPRLAPRLRSTTIANVDWGPRVQSSPACLEDLGIILLLSFKGLQKWYI